MRAGVEKDLLGHMKSLKSRAVNAPGFLASYSLKVFFFFSFLSFSFLFLLFSFFLFSFSILFVLFCPQRKKKIGSANIHKSWGPC